MSSIWAAGIPILLVDVANPVLLVAIAYALTRSRPIAKSYALILGHTLAYFLMGVLIVYGFVYFVMGSLIANGLAELFAPVVDFVVKGFVDPTRISFVIGFVLGLVLLGFAVRMSTSAQIEKQSTRSEVSEQKEGLFPSFMMGVTICVLSMPFSVPYFGFINELFSFNVESKALGLLIYNLLYALPYMLIPFAYAVVGQSIVAKLEAFITFIGSTASWFIPLLFGVLGLAFIADAIKYFLTGSGLV